MNNLDGTLHDLTQSTAQVAIEEVRRLQRFGVTAGELERYKMALLRDSAQAAEQALSVPSADQLDFIMESLALGHRVLDQRQVRLRLPYGQLATVLSAGAWSHTSLEGPLTSEDSLTSFCGLGIIFLQPLLLFKADCTRLSLHSTYVHTALFRVYHAIIYSAESVY